VETPKIEIIRLTGWSYWLSFNFFVELRCPTPNICDWSYRKLPFFDSIWSGGFQNATNANGCFIWKFLVLYAIAGHRQWICVFFTCWQV